MKNFLIVQLLLSVSLISCSQSPETKFEHSGVALTCPTGWAITEQEDYDGEGYYLSIEQEGFDSSGIMMITWINAEVDLEEMIYEYQEEYRNNALFKNADLSFTPSIEDQFNDNPSISTSFKASLLGVKHHGLINTFHKDNKTFVFVKQEADEDSADNAAGFDVIEKSFSTY